MELQQGARSQAGAHHEHQRQRDFRGHERRTRVLIGAAWCRRARRGLEVFGRGAIGGLKSGDEPGDDARHHREAERKAERREIEPRLIQAGISPGLSAMSASSPHAARSMPAQAPVP
jgi:hypothetical protein